MNCSKAMYENIAGFLLNCPAEEIGNDQVADIVESFHHNMISKREAINIITSNSKTFLEKFVYLTMENFSQLNNET